ncbi:hypothetical protein [Cohnella yongneupensis]|uniref:Cap2 central linker domain-containing protein n=1 Tax=Cohnella yongneupensis TaxID=425006 RepID=A0ABW0QUM3_9BACL
MDKLSHSRAVDDLHKISDELALGRRALESISGVRLIKDLFWLEDTKKWALHLEISIKSSNKDLIPSLTEWYVLVDEYYPRGQIKVYPSAINGIDNTFPHQSINTYKKGQLFRDGSLCLDETTKIFNKEFGLIETFQAVSRMAWHIERAKKWLQLASEDSLFLQGDPFELPEFPCAQNTLIAYSESPNSYSKWEQSGKTFGISTIIKIKKSPEAYLIYDFKTLNGEPIHENEWGQFSKVLAHSKLTAIWIRTSSFIQRPWTVPIKWSDLYRLFDEQGYNFDEFLIKVHNAFPKRKPYDSNCYSINRRLYEVSSSRKYFSSLGTDRKK